MINEIVTNTNNSISDFRKRFRDILADNDKYHHCAIADSIGIKAFFGLLHIRAALKVNMLSTMTISYHESSNELFAATMPVNRFSFLSTFLTLMISSPEMNVENMKSLLCIQNFLRK